MTRREFLTTANFIIENRPHGFNDSFEGSLKWAVKRWEQETEEAWYEAKPELSKLQLFPSMHKELGKILEHRSKYIVNLMENLPEFSK